jgi:hypothetical protein
MLVHHHGSGIIGIDHNALVHKSTALLINSHPIPSLRNPANALIIPYKINKVKMINNILLKVFFIKFHVFCPNKSPAIVVSNIPSTPILEPAQALFILTLSIVISLELICKNHCIITITINPILINPTAITGANIDLTIFGMENFSNKPV